MVKKILLTWDFIETHIIGNISMLFFACGLVVAINEVISRYIFARSLAWSNELITWLFVIGVMFNYGLAQKEKRHVRVDLLVSKMGEKAQAMSNIFGCIVGIGFCTFLIFYGLKLTFEVKRLGFGTEVLRIPTFIAYGVLVFAFFSLFIRYLVDLYTLVSNWGKR
jgi:TRAP-type C4-dicarboxylate transport system permease small subunit